MKNDPCKKIGWYGSDGTPVLVNKKSYDTDKEAIEEARKINCHDTQIHKAVAYKCPKCGKWHIGRTRKELSEKDKKHYRTIKNKI